jgi:protein-S-isoprenylcysteine O-methyltransferase Ste14
VRSISSSRTLRKLAIVSCYAAAIGLEWALTVRNRSEKFRREGSSGVEALVATIPDVVYLSGSRDPSSDLDSNTRKLLVSTSVIGLSLGWIARQTVPKTSFGNGSGLPFGIGLVAMSGGTFLRIWSIRTLGPAFDRVVAIHPGHRLIVAGPYRVLRHPAYAGSLLLYIGTGIMWANWVSVLACSLIPWAGRIPRMRVEERALHQAFGESYEIYAASTHRLIPGVL